MTHVVIYDHPKDLPGYWVVRAWTVHLDGRLEKADQAAGFLSLEKARAYVAQEWPDLVRMARSPGDDPAIFEVYI